MTNAAGTILSFQSRVTYGHVGHSVAAFALQRLRYEVWALDTVVLSSHPGHADPTGRRCSAAEVRDLLNGLDRCGRLARVNALLSGYLGHSEMADVVLEAKDRLARAGATLPPYVCDPVMGDHDRGLYVAADLVEAFRSRLAPLADVLTPNHFELERLVDRPLLDQNAVLAAARALCDRGTSLVVVSSLTPPLVPPAHLGTLAVCRQGAFRVTTPALPATIRGAGDLLTALVLAGWLSRQSIPKLLSHAVSATYAIIAATVRRGADELCLIAEQDALIRPPVRFPAVSLD